MRSRGGGGERGEGRTPGLTPRRPVLDDDEKKQRRLVHVPMGRFGEAEEMAKGALFLASEDSSFMTGASLLLDGGITSAYVTPDAPATVWKQQPQK